MVSAMATDVLHSLPSSPLLQAIEYELDRLEQAQDWEAVEKIKALLIPDSAQSSCAYTNPSHQEYANE